jgi:hypothetical protein
MRHKILEPEMEPVPIDWLVVGRPVIIGRDGTGNGKRPARTGLVPVENF